MITIDLARLESVLESAKGFEMTQEAEKDMIELLNAYKTISDAYNRLKEAFQSSEYNSIEGDLVKVTKYESGTRFVMTGEVAPELLEVKLNAKAVEEFVKKNNVLPKGVSEKSRSITVKISVK